MSLDKAIAHGQEHRKPYHAFWRTVSNLWRFCPYCGKALHLSSAEDK